MPLTILVVEDDQTVADALRDMLEEKGWRVCLRVDGPAARIEIEGDECFDLLILDNHLPGGWSGIELTRLARSLAHRRRTPIAIFSASYAEGEAKEAGANVFLRKPQDIGSLVETVERLLS